MDNPEVFLLRKIIECDGSEFKNLKSLPGNFISDISRVMEEFLIEGINETIARLNKGEEVNIGGNSYKLKL